MKEPDAFLGGLVDRVVFRVFLGVQQAVVQQGIKVIIHLLRAKVCTRHDVGFLHSACCRRKDVIYNVKFTSVLDLFFLQCNPVLMRGYL